jgi:hypothetical protein
MDTAKKHLISFGWIAISPFVLIAASGCSVYDGKSSASSFGRDAGTGRDGGSKGQSLMDGSDVETDGSDDAAADQDAEPDQHVELACDFPYQDCDDDSSNGCEERLDTLANCGTCGATCDGVSCAGGACSEIECPVGAGDCNLNAEDGCETALNTLNDCGKCGNRCGFTNASSRCNNGKCEFLKCKAGFSDCDSDLANGCETPIDTLTDCGECAKVCISPNGVPYCPGGRCTATTCDDGFADCNGDPNDGCETSLRSLEHCGSCGEDFSCGPLEHAKATCATGTCRIAECDSGYADCDGEESNGCETSLTTNQNCGQCGKACSAANTVTSCETGTCEVSPCNEGFRDCNSNMDSDGCEAALGAVETCGSCTNNCAGRPNVDGVSCASGICSIESCISGYGDCTNDPGCESKLDTITNCGTCGKSCPANGGTAVCSSGVCGVVCNFTGTYALKITAQISWDKHAYVQSGSGTFYSWSKLQITHNGNNFSGTIVSCGKDVPYAESTILSEKYKLEYPTSLFDNSYIPSVSAIGTLSNSSPGASFALNKLALLMGTSMTDPINGSWPSTASGLTSVDMDEDGKSGVTVNYQNSGSYSYAPTSDFFPDRADKAYIANRQVFSLSGTLSSCTKSTGSASITQLNTHVFGCNLADSSQDCGSSEGNFLDENTVIPTANSATYTLVKITDGATCATVRTTVP